MGSEVVGAGDAVSVNVASVPSVMDEVPAEMVTDDVPVADSLSLTLTVGVPIIARSGWAVTEPFGGIDCECGGGLVGVDGD